jgi:lipoyl(octanoyl) transferase
MNPDHGLAPVNHPLRLAAPVGWAVSPGQVDYPAALAAMEARAGAIHAGEAGELVWLLEHPPLVTTGTSASADELRQARFPVFAAGRGGRTTYHGPGQRVIYVMLDLARRGRDLRIFVAELEAWIIETLAAFGVRGLVREGRVGVWVDRSAPGAFREDKIAAIGVRVRRWVSFHGVSLNVEPDLSHFDAITPCGIAEPGLGVTSLVDLGHPVTMAEVDDVLRATFADRFGPPTLERPPA